VQRLGVGSPNAAGPEVSEGDPASSVPPVGQRVLVHVTEPIGRDALRRYAAASLDFNPMHLDDDFAREAGEPGVIAHGMLTLSIVVERVLAAFPEHARASEIDVRFGRKLDVDQQLHVWVQIDAWSEGPGSRIAHTTVSGENPDGNAYVTGQMDVAFSR
jgi:acyl dehydratase